MAGTLKASDLRSRSGNPSALMSGVVSFLNDWETNGVTVRPGSDKDTNIWSVDVTGSPTGFWDESEGAVSQNVGLRVTSGNVYIADGLPSVTGKRLIVEDDQANHDVVVKNTGTGNASIRLIGDNGAGDYKWFADDNFLGLWDANAAAERVRIDSSGNMGIGQTPIVRFHVEGASAGRISRLKNTNTSSSADIVEMIVGIDGADSGNNFITFLDNAGADTIGNISGNGTGVAYNTTSDERLKDSIEELPSFLDKIMLMRPIKYQRKGREHTTWSYGFSAQELYAIDPVLVSGVPEDDPETSPMGIDYGKLTPVLVKGLQQLTARMDVAGI